MKLNITHPRFLLAVLTVLGASPGQAVTISVTNTNDTGMGSLRQAITSANGTAAADTITFAIGTGVATIAPASSLPNITNPVTIDGTTQPGYSGTPIIVLSGASAGTGGNGISITGAGSTIKGLVINGFDNNGLKITGANAANNSVQNCYIGTNAAGTAAVPNKSKGIQLSGGAHDNTIGGLTAGTRNVIAGNTGYGILITNSGTANNVVQNCYIGINAAGTQALGNTLNGVLISAGAANNTIGGTAVEARNLIAGNGGDGVQLTGAGTNGNKISSNYFGVSATGGTQLSGTTNLLANGDHAVRITLGASNNIVGGSTPGERNVMSGDNRGGHREGVEISTAGTNNNSVKGNYIGTTINGTAALANEEAGVVVAGGAVGTQIGGTLAGEGNVISGNSSYGIVISDVDTSATLIANNFIGLNAAGTAAIGNGAGGIQVTGGNTPSGPQNTLISNNVISGNIGDGIDLQSAGTTNNQVSNNLIGTDATASTAIANTVDGIGITEGAAGNTIGIRALDNTGGNVIAGNGQYGIVIAGAGADSNRVENNTIGINASAVIIANGASGVLIADGPQNNVIVANVISGNASNGVDLTGTTTMANSVSTNFIGTNADGTLARGNTREGVFLGESAHDNTITSNVISGNGEFGILLVGGGTSGNAISTNDIGITSPGAGAPAPLANGFAGILLAGGAAGNSITDSIIGGNDAAGILISGTGTDGNTVQGNSIGTDGNPADHIGNGLSGISIEDGASNNIIGGTDSDQPNTIAFNGRDGVTVATNTAPDPAGNTIRGNHIFSNGDTANGINGLGINLKPLGEAETTVTPNDVGDADSGPNSLQNFPVLTSAVDSGSSTAINGTLNSTPSATFTIDFYANTAADPSGNGEGENYLGSTTATTDGSGNATFFLTVNLALTGQFITATATNESGDTSEFSAPLAPTTGSNVLGFSSATYAAHENAGTVTITVTRTGSTDPVTVDYATSNGTATAGSDYTATSGTLSLGAGENTKTFTVSIADDTLAEGNETVNLTLSNPTGASLGQSTATLIIADNDTHLALAVTPPLVSETAGANAVTATLTRTAPTTAALTVNLASTNPGLVTLPSSVIIPAGQTKVTFSIGVTNNNTPGGPQKVTISAAAAGYSPAKATLFVTDDEAHLTFSIAPTTFLENAGINAATGTLTRNTPTNVPLSVSLVSSNRDKVSVPPTVTIPVGQTKVTFPIGAIDNTVAEGPQRIKIAARAKFYPTVSAVVTVLDNEAKLTLTVTPPTFSEGAGANAATATVTRNTPTTDPLNVVLQSSDGTRVRLPSSITIPAGQKSLSFPVKAIDNAVADGPHSVTLTASNTNSGFAPGSTIVVVTDNDG